VNIVGRAQSESNADGSITTRQVADVVLPRTVLDSIWSPEYLERLARTYWRFLTRVSLGLIRVLYTPTSREIVLVRRPFRLLTFHAPEYELAGDRASVTWRIRKGLLVAPHGRDRGCLRISVQRAGEDGAAELASVRVTSEVADFYPLLAGWGWFKKIGAVLYRITQYAVHVVVTKAFFRSLARLDLAPSIVGALRPPQEERAAELTADR
jgi:hypothetical protein